jgi:hypothetical protein
MPIVTVRSGQSGKGPLTWGQRAMWQVMLPLGENVGRTNVASWTALPAETGVRAALDRIATLAVAYESIRTRIVPDGDDWLQVVDAGGDLDVELTPGTAADLGQIAAAERLRLKATVFAVGERWPIRFSLIVDGDRALALVWASAHVISDLWGRWALDAAAGRPGQAFDPGIQPLERATFEGSAAGREADRRAIDHYRRQIEGAGPDPFPVRAVPAHDRFRFGSFSSPAMAAGLDAHAIALRTTPAAVLRAAINSALAEEAGVDRLTMTLLAANRLDAASRAAFGSFTQFVPSTLRDARADWPTVVGRAAVANLQAFRRGAYDPRSLDQVEDQTSGRELMLDYGRRPVPPEPPRVDPATAARGRLDWFARSDEGTYAFFLWVAGDRDTLTAEIRVDTARIGVDQAERVLVRAEEKLASSAG